MNKKRLINFMGIVKRAWSVVFNGTSTVIIASAEATINNLSDDAFTVEAWIKASPLTASGSGIVCKNTSSDNVGFTFRLNSSLKLYAIVRCATTSPQVNSLTLVADNIWHHVAMTWDDAGDRKIRTWLDGVQDGISSAGVGAIVADTSADMNIGRQPAGNLELLGNVGWCRVSNSIRYSTTFIPPSRFQYPTVDANTVRLFKMNEGTGTTIVDYSANAQNATLANGTWVKV